MANQIKFQILMKLYMKLKLLPDIPYEEAN